VTRSRFHGYGFELHEGWWFMSRVSSAVCVRWPGARRARRGGFAREDFWMKLHDTLREYSKTSRCAGPPRLNLLRIDRVHFDHFFFACTGLRTPYRVVASGRGDVDAAVALAGSRRARPSMRPAATAASWQSDAAMAQRLQCCRERNACRRGREPCVLLSLACCASERRLGARGGCRHVSS
jgi:hypothetical protein